MRPTNDCDRVVARASASTSTDLASSCHKPTRRTDFGFPGFGGYHNMVVADFSFLTTTKQQLQLHQQRQLQLQQQRQQQRTQYGSNDNDDDNNEYTNDNVVW